MEQHNNSNNTKCQDNHITEWQRSCTSSIKNAWIYIFWFPPKPDQDNDNPSYNTPVPAIPAHYAQKNRFPCYNMQPGGTFLYDIVGRIGMDDSAGKTPLHRAAKCFTSWFVINN